MNIQQELDTANIAHDIVKVGLAAYNITQLDSQEQLPDDPESLKNIVMLVLAALKVERFKNTIFQKFIKTKAEDFSAFAEENSADIETNLQ